MDDLDYLESEFRHEMTLDKVKDENARLKVLFAHVVTLADDWYDECRGSGWIKNDTLMSEARSVIRDMQTHANTA